MKRIMIALGVVAVAAVTHAASVTWGGAIANGDADTEMTSGSVAYLLWSDTAFKGEATSVDKFDVGGVADNGGSIVQAYNITSGQIEGYSFQTSYATAGSVDGYYAILVSDGSDLTKASYMDMGSIAGTTSTSPVSSLLFNADWDDEASYLTMGGYPVSTSAVPEPTSGLLLLLGMAGLALKRKIA